MRSWLAPVCAVATLLVVLPAVMLLITESTARRGAGQPMPAVALFEPVDLWERDAWRLQDKSDLEAALRRVCGRLESQEAEAPMIRAKPAFGLRGEWEAACRAVLAAGPEDLSAAVERHFRPMAVRIADEPDSPGLATGYFEPEIAASLTRDETYRWPILGRPDDLLTFSLSDFGLGNGVSAGRVEGDRFLPYPTRAEIEAGGLGDRAETLAWADDPARLFFLQIQGSGRLRLPDGTSRGLGFAATNGRPYTAIGRLLVERGRLTSEEASMQSILAWLAAHPEEGQALMDENERYVFFRWREGPVGSFGTVLTPMRSVAVDPSYVPLGAPLWIETRHPLTSEPLRRLVFAEDTGGAIEGPLRLDFFWGPGEIAAEAAGAMAEPVEIVLLVPESVADHLESSEP